MVRKGVDWGFLAQNNNINNNNNKLFSLPQSG